MKLIYLSTDELNWSLVRSWAARKGVEVECPSRLDRVNLTRGTALLIDTDHLPLGSLEAVLAHCGAATDSPPIAAHGYGAIGDVLRGRGLDVKPRLLSRVLEDLASAAMSSDWAQARDTSDDLTWVNLV
jgi:hypothetical protein